MKIGIVTFYRVPNYGAMLQAYSLWKYLEARGHEVVFIQHKRCIAKRIPFWKCFVSRRLTAVKMKLKNYVRFAMTEFAKDYPQTRYCETVEDVKRSVDDFDAFVVGSDQMWNPLWFSSKDLLPLVMLDFAAANTPRIAYAASFGTSEWREDQNSVAAGMLLRKFQAISVREGSGVELVRSLSGRNDALCLLDPTLLQTAKFYRNIITSEASRPEKDDKKPYVFSYILDEWDDGDQIYKALEVVKDRLGIPIVETDRITVGGLLGPICKMFRAKSKINVVGWLEKIANADFVFTNSFHGTVFAILFHKPFVTMLIHGRMAGMNERVFSLLKICGLIDRAMYAHEIDKIKVIASTDVNWENVDIYLSVKRELTDTFFKNTLTQV